MVLLYTIAGFLIVPAVMKSQLPKIVQELTGRKTSVEEIKFNPYAMTLSIQGYETQEADGPRFVGFKELFVNFQPWASIGKRAVTLEEIRLEGFYGHIAVLTDNSLNFSDLLELGGSEPEEASKEENDSLFPIWITDLKIQNSEVEFDHLGLEQPFEAKATPINLELKNLTTLVTEGAPSKLTANLISGGSLNWQGTLSLNPLNSKGHLDITGLNVHKAWTFIQGLVDFEIKEGGEINLAADYTFDGSGDELQFLIPSAKVNLEGFKLSEKGQEPSLIDIPGFAIEGITFDLAKRQVTIADVSSQNAVIQGWLSPGYVLNYQTLFVPDETINSAVPPAPAEGESGHPDPPMTIAENKTGSAEPSSVVPAENPPAETASTSSTAADKTEPIKPPENPATESNASSTIAAVESSATDSAPPDAAEGSDSAGAEPAQESGTAMDIPWLISVNKLSLNNYAIHFEDRTQKEVIPVNLTPITITASNFSTKPGAKMQLDTNITMNETGFITIRGDVGIDPVITNLTVAIEKISLKPIQPYVAAFSKLVLVDGEVHVDGKLDFSLTENNQPMLRYSGNAGVANLHTVDARDVPAEQKDIFKWSALNVNGLEFDLEPMQLKVGEVLADSPFARVIINQDGTTNLNEIFVPADGEESPAKAAEKTDEPTPETKQTAATGGGEIPPISIGQIKIDNASTFFADLSLILPFGVQIGDLNGAVKGLSSDEKSRADVFLKGKVDKVSPVTIQGSITPFHADTYSNIRMQFESVNLTTATPYMAQFAGYKIDKGTISLDLNYKISRRKLAANNQVIIDQLTLGEEVDSPDAVSIPVKLAIALLTDSNGVIDLELPISGSLDDPEFSVGRLIGKVLLNLVKKVVLSPFTLIASLAGSDDDLSQVEFSKGVELLSRKQRKRLDSLAEGLKERPELKLEVRGVAVESKDWPVIAENILLNELKQSKWNEMSQSGDAPASPKQIELSISEYERLLGERFKRDFPQEAETFKAARTSDDPKISAGFYNMAKEKLIANKPVNQSAMKLLAKSRAENITQYLIEQGKIAHDRFFLMDLQIVPGETEEGPIIVPLTLTAS